MHEAGAISETAPAKINLALHVTGQRADGYHLLDTLVTFAADACDRLTFEPSDHDGFSLCGRFAELLSPAADGAGGNLVLKARDQLRSLFAQAGRPVPAVHITLEKNLPVASGIGGGSADAAAAIRGLQRFWGDSLPKADIAAMALTLGADVPMCLISRPLKATGIGESLELLPDMPGLCLVLANPLQPVSTPDIFRRLASKTNPAMPPLADSADPDAWLTWLASLRNDLEPPARALLADIAMISQMLSDQGAMLVRMSGSGATCFGLFADDDRAAAAAQALMAEKPNWYFYPTHTIAGTAPPLGQTAL
ncbi:MAG: 4-(cytidine 5'-diphospho)-2-C-methyl-D-erythritol kinase [Allorhizobium sp.]